MRAATAGTLGLAEPLAAAPIRVLLPHEHLSPAAWSGCALILAGTIGARLPPIRRSRSGERGTDAALESRASAWPCDASTTPVSGLVDAGGLVL